MPFDVLKMFMKTVKFFFLRSNNVIIYNCCGLRTARASRITTDFQVLPKEEIETKILKLAVIGVPNAGKSTFINNLMGRKVCAASNKVHTTRVRARAILNEGNSQIVLVDTPGIVNEQERNRYKLGKPFELDRANSLSEVDIIGVIHDASHRYNQEKLDFKVMRVLNENKDKPSFLVLNKVDIVKSKRKLLDLTRLLTENHLRGKLLPGLKNKETSNSEIKGWRHFERVFMVSALTGDGLSELKNYLLSQCKPGEFLFPSDAWTDQSVESIILNSVKAVLLHHLPQEMPYRLKPQIELLEVNREGIITTVVLVNCESERIANFISGASDGRLKKMTEQVQVDLQNTFKNFVRIKIVTHYVGKK